MKTKQIVTIVLLVFVVGSVAAMIYKELQTKPVESNLNVNALAHEDQPQHQIIAYYFFGNQRCPTCRNIEAYTFESLETYYQDELESKRLVWNPVNLEIPGNEHYAADFELDMKMVVLAEMRDGQQVRWKKLDRVWSLSGDREAFLDYVKSETEEYIEAL